MVVKKKKASKSEYPTLKLIDEKEIAMDFATKVYSRFDKMIKSVLRMLYLLF